MPHHCGVETRQITQNFRQLIRINRAVKNLGLCAAPRTIKDAGEIAAMRRAIAITEQALDDVLDVVRVGMS